MTQIVECVPNFSEGRRRKVIEQIAAAVAATPGARLLDVQADESHNRCVISFVGDLAAVQSAARAAAAVAVTLIDMTAHRGEHPRMGAVDVIPLVPISGVSMEECVAAARALGANLWKTLRVPVFFYAQAAMQPSRRRLPDIRKGQFEGLAEKLRDPAWAPDVGDPVPHPTAGAVVVGARGPLIAYNINLTTDEVNIAQDIAKAVRESSGGLLAVQAKGVRSEAGQAQVSMNLVDFVTTPVHRAYEAVREAALAHGVDVAESQVVGLIPLDALTAAARHYLKLTHFERAQILETRLME